jgi:hypothetical protein
MSIFLLGGEKEMSGQTMDIMLKARMDISDI